MEIVVIILISLLVTAVGILSGILLAVKKQLKDLEHYLYIEVMHNQHFD